MHQMKQLPIWRDANQLMVAIELAVRHFPRYHKYSLGTDLRRQAMTVCRLIVRAYNVNFNNGNANNNNKNNSYGVRLVRGGERCRGLLRIFVRLAGLPCLSAAQAWHSPGSKL